jgi:hypothetical protein
VKAPVPVAHQSEGVERRTRRVPWGVQIEVWERTNTITVPESAAGAMPVSSLLDPLPGEAAGSSPASELDDDTIDVVDDLPRGWHSIEPDDEPIDPALVVDSPDSE